MQPEWTTMFLLLLILILLLPTAHCHCFTGDHNDAAVEGVVFIFIILLFYEPPSHATNTAGEAQRASASAGRHPVFTSSSVQSRELPQNAHIIYYIFVHAISSLHTTTSATAASDGQRRAEKGCSGGGEVQDDVLHA